MPESATVPHILVVDDDKEVRYSLNRVLSSQSYQVSEAPSGEEGVAAVKRSPPDVVLLDNRMTGMTGLETLQHIRAANPRQLVILMTAFGTAQTAIEAMKFGAFDYVVKPFDPPKLLALVESALRTQADIRSAGGVQPVINSEEHKEGIVGASAPMQQVFKVIGQVAASDVTVMITGESGTGKELVARSIHRHSHRGGKPFVAVNCSAIPENLIESELFGHERGAFTGATAQRLGKFEACDGGTIFLDEIGDMTPATQTKILRVLQEGEIQRVGGSETLKVNVRVIAATNKDLEALVKAKEFREDLYYRLNVVRLRLPPLRERVEDVPQIVDFFLQNLAKGKKTKARKVSPEALAILCRHNWPGNVRELENMVYRSAVIAQGDAILPKDLPDEVRQSTAMEARPAGLETLFDQLYLQLKTTQPADMLAVVKTALEARDAASKSAETAAAAPKPKKPAAKKK
ncbi:MAG TPA: sigma-54 dependent transcriptional regulator [Lacunisphaera sp.]|nr:sigma-54 dependent transcriptional regulator [Lacunisphaera sp.]